MSNKKKAAKAAAAEEAAREAAARDAEWEEKLREGERRAGMQHESLPGVSRASRCWTCAACRCQPQEATTATGSSSR